MNLDILFLLLLILIIVLQVIFLCKEQQIFIENDDSIIRESPFKSYCRCERCTKKSKNDCDNIANIEIIEKQEIVDIDVKKFSIYESIITINKTIDQIPIVSVFFQNYRGNCESNCERVYQDNCFVGVPISTENGYIPYLFWRDSHWVLQILTGISSVAVNIDPQGCEKYHEDGFYRVVIK